MRPSGDLPSNMLADVFESVVGAIYLDGGMDAARPFIVRFLDPEIDRVVVEYPRYAVVQKTLAAAVKIARQTDPRAWRVGPDPEEAWRPVTDPGHRPLSR